jgi:hypothetical protein
MREVLATGCVVAAFGAVSFGCGARTAPRSSPPAVARTAEAHDWRRGGTCYEIFVRSFADGDGDGIGDLRGLTEKLDYINDGNASTDRDLSARCIWLMPVNESSSYHGYDATDYYRVERDYGPNDDFKRFVAEAHRRGIAVLVDMVLTPMQWSGAASAGFTRGTPWESLRPTGRRRPSHGRPAIPRRCSTSTASSVGSASTTRR